jgi:muskelin
LLTPFQTILSRADIQLEHPFVTQLHESLVLRGDWSRSEKLLDVLSSAGLFDNYLQSCQPYAMWTRLLGTDADGDVPPARGGHAMCIDPVNEMVYIFGGWDGEKSMDDFWAYSIKEDKWQVLSHSTSKEQNAPGARSCHKMVFDTKTGSIYLLGGLNDADGLRAPVPSNARTPAGASTGASTGAPSLPQQIQQQQPSTSTSEETASKASSCSEFYRYHTRGVDSGKWDFLAFDTAVSPERKTLLVDFHNCLAVLWWSSAGI